MFVIPSGDVCSVLRWIKLHFFALFLILFPILVYSDSRRPVFNVAHMVNSIKELEDFLARGANAVELDITFYKNGTVKQVYHGYPCDCYRICDEKEKLPAYLNYVRDLVDPKIRKSHKPLTMLFFDLKLDEVTKSQKFTAGEEIAKHIISHLWNKDISEPRIYVLISIGHTADSDTIRGIRETFIQSNRGTFLNKIGFDVGLNDDLSSIKRMWNKLDIHENRWQGDGITNCLRPFKDDARLKQAIRYRDSSNGFIEKVYDWTVDLTANMRHSFRLGVDAVLTNFPERVHSVLLEPEFKIRYRLATYDDDPFTKLSLTSTKSISKRPDLDTYVASIREMTMAVMGYFYDFYRLRLANPSTLFPLLETLLFKKLPTLLKYRTPLGRNSVEFVMG